MYISQCKKKKKYIDIECQLDGERERATLTQVELRRELNRMERNIWNRMDGEKERVNQIPTYIDILSRLDGIKEKKKRMNGGG